MCMCLLKTQIIGLLPQEDPNGFLQQYAGKTILDEVQRVLDLFSYLQTAVDRSGQMGQ